MNALAFKEQGNSLLLEGKFEEAINAYTEAIVLNPRDHIFYSNRAAAYINIGNFVDSLKDAAMCVELSPLWPKGYLRKCSALRLLYRFDEAIETLRIGLNNCPSNSSISQGLSDLLKVAE